ncbi:MAG TPA: hypothetical protein VGN73_04340 [Gemmatimonadaceae bacterium]|nr:hypothetical protein [Gemmatimonadaceae bacterium]
MRHTKRLLSLIAVMALAACTDNGIFNPNQDLSGTYDLTVFAGRTVPTTYTIAAGDPDFPNGGTFVVNDGSLQLNSNGTFVETNNFTSNPNGQSSYGSQFVSRGTWTVNGTTISLSAPAQGTNPARPARNIVANIDFDAQNRATVFFQEDDGTGNVQSYEYKR